MRSYLDIRVNHSCPCVEDLSRAPVSPWNCWKFGGAHSVQSGSDASCRENWETWLVPQQPPFSAAAFLTGHLVHLLTHRQLRPYRWPQGLPSLVGPSPIARNSHTGAVTAPVSWVSPGPVSPDSVLPSLSLQPIRPLEMTVKSTFDIAP